VWTAGVGAKSTAGTRQSAACRAALLTAVLGAIGCVDEPDVVAVAMAEPTPTLLELDGDIALSDPAAIHDNETYWVFSTGDELPIRSSGDLHSFVRAGSAFAVAPAWIAQEVPEATSLWSPDVAFFGGQYHLYYAVSTRGDNQSCIGHATADSLPSIEAWTDRGPLICSKHGDDWNAIDPNVLDDQQGAHWLALGSFRSGLKLILLDDEGARIGSDFVPLAKRPTPGMIQAPALSYHGGYYYLFAALGEGEGHTLIVGRGSSIRGPYVDRSGEDLWDGGGTLLLADSERFVGPGSNDVLTVNDQFFNFYHAYDREDGDQPQLRVSTLVWDAEGWPLSAGP
jgi:arabinan endo-1,5-alpha-L-arabinosidase